jgi:hypothetical protein
MFENSWPEKLSVVSLGISAKYISILFSSNKTLLIFLKLEKGHLQGFNAAPYRRSYLGKK